MHCRAASCWPLPLNNNLLCFQNRDGLVSLDEVITYLFSTPRASWPVGLRDLNPFMKQSLKARMGEMDADGDGVLTQKEFETWWSAHSE